METMGAQYDDIYKMPYSRRQRLVEWKVERMREADKAQQEARARSSRR